MRKRVYIAGAYSATNYIDVLHNMQRGMKLGAKVLKAGYAPFVPWFDYHFSLIDEEITLEDYQDYAMSWLEASECVLVVPNSEHSKGTIAEIKRARELNISVNHSFIEMDIDLSD
jgi:microcystin degradation protein MlrC